MPFAIVRMGGGGNSNERKPTSRGPDGMIENTTYGEEHSIVSKKKEGADESVIVGV